MRKSCFIQKKKKVVEVVKKKKSEMRVLNVAEKPSVAKGGY